MLDKYADQLCRKCAAKYSNTTPGSLATIDCTKQYDLKPFKKEDGKVYYHRTVLDEFAERNVKP